MGSLKDLVELINEIRASNDVGLLLIDEKLTDAAELHAAFMLQHNILSHSGRNESNFETRVRDEGYSYSRAAENIAFGVATNEEVLDLWMNSPPHKDNLINPDFTQIGIGVAPVLYQAPKDYQRYWSLSLAAPSVTKILLADPIIENKNIVVDPF